MRHEQAGETVDSETGKQRFLQRFKRLRAALLAPFLGAHTADGVTCGKAFRNELAGTAANVHNAAFFRCAKAGILRFTLAGKHIDAHAAGSLHAGEKNRAVARIPHSARCVGGGHEPFRTRFFGKGGDRRDAAFHGGFRKHAGGNEPFRKARCDEAFFRRAAEIADGVAADVDHGKISFFHGSSFCSRTARPLARRTGGHRAHICGAAILQCQI